MMKMETKAQALTIWLTFHCAPAASVRPSELHFVLLAKVLSGTPK